MRSMLWTDALGALATLVALGLLGLAGALLALRLLRERAASDPLLLALATLVGGAAVAVGLGLLLGAFGLLRIALALPLLAALVVLLARFPRAVARADFAPFAHLARRAGARLSDYPALALITLHAAGSEALRGLLRPPLSWDSLMYHLLLAATWLQRGDLGPVLGPVPINYYGYAPGNGALGLWWWMAPSHSELYVNLAALPAWLLLGLAAGAVARQLGASRHWPLAVFLTLNVPAVVRFAATQYVDIPTAACLAAACACGLAWLRAPRWAEALLAGAALGLAAGTKVLGVFYGAALAVALLAAARGEWRRRLPQAAAALAIAAALGGFFYARNLALGTDPLAAVCEGTARGEPPERVGALPRAGSVVTLPRAMLAEGQLLDALLGITLPSSLELGVGPQAFVLLAALLALPWGLARARRREGAVVLVQVLLHLVFWATVAYAAQRHVFANPRYLLATVALLFAAGVAIAETRGVPERGLRLLVLALLVQDLLMLHAAMPRGARVAIGAADLAALALLLAPRLRAAARRRLPALAAAALLAALLLAPAWARFRVAHRGRALAWESTVHATPARHWAPAWRWLERHDAEGTVAVVGHPTYFVYPAMGPRFERRAVYVNVNRADRPGAAEYPACNPRVDLNPEAWLANLRRAGVRWLHVYGYPERPWPVEWTWAEARPRRFRRVFADARNRLYEVLPESDVQ